MLYEKTRTDAKLGDDAMVLDLPSIFLSLRHFLERMARSVCHAAGTFLYLDGTTQFKDSGGCSELQQTELVLLLQGAANAHAAWDANALKPRLCERAAELGYSKVLLVPMGYSACEDATNGTLAPHFMNHDHFVSARPVAWAASLPSPTSQKTPCPPKTTRGAARRTQRASQLDGMDELLRLDAGRLLIVDHFPGLSVQPPEGERWLFILSPYLAGISGDLQGIYKSYAFKRARERRPPAPAPFAWCRTTSSTVMHACTRNGGEMMFRSFFGRSVK